MREDVLSLRAMGGDRVSEEYLKAELYHRAEALADIPDTPLFFGRLDYAGQSATEQSGSRNYGSEISDDGVAGHSFHIGRRHVHAPDGTPAVIDWRGPGAPPVHRGRPAPPQDPGPPPRLGASGREPGPLQGQR